MCRRVELGEGIHYKIAQVGARMRQGQRGGIDHQPINSYYVNVNRAVAVASVGIAVRAAGA